MTSHPVFLPRRAWLLHLALACVLIFPATAAETKRTFDLPSDLAVNALKAFARQSGTEVLIPDSVGRTVRTRGVKGEMTPREAIDAMLRDTGLVVEQGKKNGVFAVRPANEGEAKNPSRRPENDRTANAGDPVLALDDFVVTERPYGSRNLDLPRSPDDTLPFIAIDRRTIERSGASTLEEFTRRLPQNTLTASFGQRAGMGQNASAQISAITLRGLSPKDTLVLVNGRRGATFQALGAASNQFDLNTIPLSAIERIEFLPSSASALYGSSATAGVINLVLKSSYIGAEVSARYGNTFDSDTQEEDATLAYGVGFNSGRSNLLLTLSFRDQNSMRQADRGYSTRLRDELVAKHRSVIDAGPNPPPADLANISHTTYGSAIPGYGPFVSAPRGYAGNGVFAPVTGFSYGLANAGRFALNNQANGDQIDLVAAMRRHNLNLFGHHQLSDRLRLSGEANYGELTLVNIGSRTAASATVPSANPFSPFTIPVRAQFYPTDVFRLPQFSDDNRSKNQRYLLALELTLEDWKWTADVSYGRFAFGFATASFNGTSLQQAVNGALPGFAGVYYNPFIDFGVGAGNRADLIDRLWEVNDGRRLSDSATANLRTTGTLRETAAGPWRLSAGFESRSESIFRNQNFTVTSFAAPVRSFLGASDSRTVASGFVETTLPLLKDGALLRTLELHLAARYESFNDFGHSLDPQVGFKVKPADFLTLRASWGTGFQPPYFSELVRSPPGANPVTITDPRRGQSYGGVIQTGGGNPELEPEKSEAVNLGLILQPRALPGLRFSLDYYRIEKEDNIASLSAATLLQNETVFPGRVTRAAPEPNAPNGVGLVTAINTSNVNATRLETEGLDLAASYTRPLHGGDLQITAAGTAVFSFQQQLAVAGPLTEFVNQPYQQLNAPLRYKGFMSVYWDSSRFGAGITARYVHSYASPVGFEDINGSRIDASVEFDVQASYRFTLRNRNRSRFDALTDGLTLNAGVNNLFDTRPPFVAGGAANLSGGYSFYNDPRQAVYYLSLKKTY
ncbi:MAG: TonB-dependent receptor [Verrucomicrobia bacterium]|nr:TonB-dependent receptor [Verrucomicrobiota bacterium]